MGMIYGSNNYTLSGRKKKRISSAKKSSVKSNAFKPLQPKPKTYADFRREELQQYPSRDDGTAGATPRREPQKYTGTFVKGIATMHKSNAVPVTSDEQAIDLARMRR